ncbi:MAG: ABC transporter ATP-binding protein [Candidatus Edwardsbacteria bacterium]|nr:ABC transporter ATP-binding protein [Candidatus Edwardsbacteria bacterium]
MTKPLVEISGLQKSFGPHQVLKGIDLDVLPGEMLAMVGPDGAGKTTLIRAICGLLPFQSGRISVLGHEVPSRMDMIKPHIGYLSQRFSLYGDLTVDENIEFFAEIHGVRDYRARRDELLDFTRMKPFRSRLAERLSGGMKQKLALACTLVHTPKVIFLDEPTTGVDPVSRRDFWKILSRLLADGLTIFLTTPYMDEAERCSRVAMLDNGNILALDSPQNIKLLMGGQVMELVCQDIKKAAKMISEELGPVNVQTFGDRLNVMMADQEKQWPGLIEKLTAAGVECDKWQEVSPSLENVFIKLMKPK